MNSGSDIQSSEDEAKHKNREKRSRSRERERERERRHDRGENKDRDRKIRILIPELSAPFLSFKHFCNLQTEKISTESLQKGYEKYKRDWEQRQNEEFLKQYKKDAWFSEKYDPEVLDLLERDRRENNKRLSVDFLSQLENGSFDDIDLRIKEPSQLGVVEQADEEDQGNLNLSSILNQTFDIHMNPLIDITRGPYFGFDQDLCTLFIKAVPRPISRYDIRTVVEKLQGYKYLTMSDPVKKMNLTRFCWIEFSSEESCNRAVLTLSGVMIKNQPLTVSKSNTKVKRVKVFRNYPSVRLEADIDTVARLIAKLDQEIGIPAHYIADRQYANLNAKFDTLLLYLRRVHAYDYFTGTSYENQRILSLKGGSAFLRMSDDTTELDNVHSVFKSIQQRSQQRILKGSDVPDYMNILRDEIEIYIRETEKIGKDDFKQIWKCMYCEKKFKTCDFLSKHIIARHEEIKNKKIQVVAEKLYLRDPFKITFNSLGDRSHGRKVHYQSGSYRRDTYRRRQGYRDFDEPEGERTTKATTAPKLVNFLDI